MYQKRTEGERMERRIKKMRQDRKRQGGRGWRNMETGQRSKLWGKKPSKRITYHCWFVFALNNMASLGICKGGGVCGVSPNLLIFHIFHQLNYVYLCKEYECILHEKKHILALQWDTWMQKWDLKMLNLLSTIFRF